MKIVSNKRLSRALQHKRPLSPNDIQHFMYIWAAIWAAGAICGAPLTAYGRSTKTLLRGSNRSIGKSSICEMEG
jgi:hypothetical protein